MDEMFLQPSFTTHSSRQKCFCDIKKVTLGTDHPISLWILNLSLSEMFKGSLNLVCYMMCLPER